MLVKLNTSASPRDTTTSITNTPISTVSRSRVAEMPAMDRARRPGPSRNARFASATHSGQWWPTGAGIMHAGQIGLLHREQWIRVSSPGWR